MAECVPNTAICNGSMECSTDFDELICFAGKIVGHKLFSSLFLSFVGPGPFPTGKYYYSYKIVWLQFNIFLIKL